MLEQVSKILQSKCFLDHKGQVLVGVSGGPDSVCLLDVLFNLGYPLIIAHLDHGLRPEAKEEALFVNQLAAAFGVECIIGHEDAYTHSQRNHLSVEEAARELRYRFLFDQALKKKAQAVAVAHNADDQVETVLMHLLRGAGLSGLVGMDFYSLPNAWSSTIPLVRPLLSTWRVQIIEYIENRNLNSCTDLSNQDRRYYRNKLRLELLPFLEQINPGASQRIWQTTDILREENRWLKNAEVLAWEMCCAKAESGFVSLSASRLASQPLALQRRLFRRAIAALRPSLRNIDYASIERAMTFVQSPARSSELDLIAGLRLSLEGDTLWLSSWKTDLPTGNWPQLEVNQELILQIPGITHLPDGWHVHSLVIPVDPALLEQIQVNQDLFEAWLDFETLKPPILLRTRKNGDVFLPFGLGGHTCKVSEFMINHKIPRRARDNWPLLVSDGEITWISGVRSSHLNRVSDSTQQILRIKLARGNEMGS